MTSDPLKQVSEREASKWFVVQSPEWDEVIPILDFGQGPREPGRDVLFVRAAKRSRAQVLALRAWRRRFGKTSRDRYYRSAGENPFRGMLVTRCDRLESVPDEGDES